MDIPPILQIFDTSQPCGNHCVNISLYKWKLSHFEFTVNLLEDKHIINPKFPNFYTYKNY